MNGHNTKVTVVNKIQDPSLQRAFDTVQEIAEKGMNGNMETIKGGITKKDVTKLKENVPYFDEKNSRFVVKVGNKLFGTAQMTEITK